MEVTVYFSFNDNHNVVVTILTTSVSLGFASNSAISSMLQSISLIWLAILLRNSGFKSQLCHGICLPTIVNTTTMASIVELVF